MFAGGYKALAVAAAKADHTAGARPVNPDMMAARRCTLGMRLNWMPQRALSGAAAAAAKVVCR